MKLFKKRLVESIIAIALVLVALIVSTIITILSYAMVNYFPNIATFVMIGGIVICAGFLLTFFVNWLIIEPFRKRKSE